MILATIAITIGIGLVVGVASYAASHAADWLEGRIAAYFINISGQEFDV